MFGRRSSTRWSIAARSSTMKTTMSGWPIGVWPPVSGGPLAGLLGAAEAGTPVVEPGTPVVVAPVAPGEPFTVDGEERPGGGDEGGGSVLAQAPAVTAASAMARRRRRIE